MSKNEGRSGSASTDSCEHNDDTRAMTRIPSRSSRSDPASSATILLTSASICWKNCHAARAFGAWVSAIDTCIDDVSASGRRFARISRGRASWGLHLRPNDFRLQVCFQARLAGLVAPTGLLVAAEGHRVIELHLTVEAHGPGLQPLGYPM